MHGYTASVFRELDDYQAALRRDGGFDLVVTGHGEFRAELTRIRLPRAHLMAGAENLARVAFISLPTDLVVITLPTRGGGSLFSGGIALREDEIVVHGPGQRMHQATKGPCHWRTIRFPSDDLRRYGRAMIGRTLGIPVTAFRCRPQREALRRLSRLHDDATRMSRVRPAVLADAEAIRGLEQELITGLIDCMRERTTDADATAIRHVDIMCRFEDVLAKFPHRPPSIADICSALGVPDRTLRACCRMQLGMGPHRYLRLRQMQHVRRALRGADPRVTRISLVARQYGFDTMGRFAASYRDQFGELPSETIKRHASR
jgi:AraC-like DNA-binding protein